MTLCRVVSRAVLCCALVGLLSSRPARAGSAGSEEARGYFDKASAAFALGHYPAAAENYEKAFELKPDPALLYNAAQAHRLGGNKERALILYQNYLRVYAKAGKRTEVESRIEELKKAIERDRELATSPPTTTMPTTSLPLAAPSEPNPPASSADTPGPAESGSPVAPPPPVLEGRSAPLAAVLIDQPQPALTENRPLTKKPLFWAAVGGVVAAAVVVVLVVALSGPKDPSPSFGVVK